MGWASTNSEGTRSTGKPSTLAKAGKCPSGAPLAGCVAGRVAPKYHRQGVGIALAPSLLDEARRTAYPRAFLRVFPYNHVASACYVRTSFTPVNQADH